MVCRAKRASLRFYCSSSLLPPSSARSLRSAGIGRRTHILYERRHSPILALHGRRADSDQIRVEPWHRAHPRGQQKHLAAPRFGNGHSSRPRPWLRLLRWTLAISRDASANTVEKRCKRNGGSAYYQGRCDPAKREYIARTRNRVDE